VASWREVDAQAPELAARARAIFEAHKHKTMATLRRDGSPRISGTEADFSDGEVWLGSMPDAMKARDLQRDPRFALHSATVDPEMAEGDAKLAGTVEEITDDDFKAARSGSDQPPGPYHLYRCDITELVVTSVSGDRLVIESWHPDRGVERRERT
jgi:pyridoxamine 5'-phosphate oxidase-like protein